MECGPDVKAAFKALINSEHSPIVILAKEPDGESLGSKDTDTEEDEDDEEQDNGNIGLDGYVRDGFVVDSDESDDDESSENDSDDDDESSGNCIRRRKYPLRSEDARKKRRRVG
jgi:hypothetical protein